MAFDCEFLRWLAYGDGRVPRLTVVVAHPDDETVGAGARLDRLHDASFVFVTDGAPRNLSDARSAGFDNRREYAGARRCELKKVFELAGIGVARYCCLNLIDQESAFHMAQCTEMVFEQIRETEPEAILTHPYEGGHPDHDTTTLAVHLACRILRREYGWAPAILEMSSYHNSSHGLRTATFLPCENAPAITALLSPHEQDFKRRLLACYVTQTRTLQIFSTEVECFRLAPDYDFTRPPHEGRLYYERFNWGVTGERWRELARRCLQELD
jgi:LmbE family N-acetylglucosaminyl deacetylase